MNKANYAQTPYGDPQAQAEEGRSKPQKSASAFRTISEVAEELGVQQHVLRFWETKFSQVRPLKRGGGRRYYRPEDVALLKHIHHLLYTEGYTIKGVQKLLKGQGRTQIVENSGAPQTASTKPKVQPAAESKISQQSDLSEGQKSGMEDILSELKELRSMVKGE